MPRIKTCPFCGSVAYVTHKHGQSRVECTQRFRRCPVNMRTEHHQSDANAIVAWNTRAKDK